MAEGLDAPPAGRSDGSPIERRPRCVDQWRVRQPPRITWVSRAAHSNFVAGAMDSIAVA